MNRGRRDGSGFITLNRPKALNSLSLDMVRDLTAALLAWRDDPPSRRSRSAAQGKARPLAPCAPAATSASSTRPALRRATRALEDFFTEEYALNHLIHDYPEALHRASWTAS